MKNADSRAGFEAIEGVERIGAEISRFQIAQMNSFGDSVKNRRFWDRL
jgi:hypothetical protein